MSRPAAAWVLGLAVVACTDGTDVAPADTDTDTVAEAFVHDPLSTPATPTLDPSAFPEADSCVTCHPDHVAAWRTSAHAHAMTDPVFRRLVQVRQVDFAGQQDPFCLQCHSAIATRGGEIVPGFSFDDLSPVALEGVTCVSCHKVTGLQRTWNSGHVLDADAPMQGPIDDPAPNAFHTSAASPLHAEARFCGGCHDVVEVSGLPLERPYQEWTTSPAAEAGTPCQSCHMPARTGMAAVGGTEREVHDHRFVGVDLPLEDVPAAERDARRADVLGLLHTAASLTVDAPPASRAGDQIDVVLTVDNRIDAHNLPTGSTFNRQLWLEVVATDADGAVLYATGTLDDRGDLRNYWSTLDPYGDHDLITLGAAFTDAHGDPELFPWSAEELTSTALPPLHDRTFTVFVPTTPTTPGPIAVRARLLFRQLPPYLLRELGLSDALPFLEVLTVDEATLTVTLEGAPE
ncbi:MAG: hypothetical protein H6733_03070 [Alphaproteobacteria bacterium]|nr:hypothetical protein [Alphaproteobacteria bacterium]